MLLTVPQILLLTYPIEKWPVPYRLSCQTEQERFLDALANEAGIRGACRAMGMAYGSVYRFLATNKDFKSKVYSFLELLPQILQEEAREIADNATPETWGVDRLRADVRMRTAGYHKQQNIEVNVDNRKQTINVVDSERAEWIARRERALANRENQPQLTEGKK